MLALNPAAAFENESVATKRVPVLRPEDQGARTRRWFDYVPAVFRQGNVKKTAQQSLCCFLGI